MATIALNSNQFTNGEAISTTEEMTKKIKLANVDVTGNVVVGVQTSTPTEIAFLDTPPVFGTLSANIDFNTAPAVIVSEKATNTIVSETDPSTGVVSYYAVFHINVQGAYTFGGQDYYVQNKNDEVKVKLLVDSLANPNFGTGTTFEVFVSASTGYVSKDDNKAYYTITIKSFSVPVEGQTDVYVALVTAKP